MKIELILPMSGLYGCGWTDPETDYRHAPGENWPPMGTVMLTSDEEGADLCRKGIARPVVEARTEKAVPPAAEKRASRKAAKDEA